MVRARSIYAWRGLDTQESETQEETIECIPTHPLAVAEAADAAAVLEAATASWAYNKAVAASLRSWVAVVSACDNFSTLTSSSSTLSSAFFAAFAAVRARSYAACASALRTHGKGERRSMQEDGRRL